MLWLASIHSQNPGDEVKAVVGVLCCYEYVGVQEVRHLQGPNLFSQFVEHRGVVRSREFERLSMQRAALYGVGNQCADEAFSQAVLLGVVVIAAGSGPTGLPNDTIELVFELFPVAIPVPVGQVEDPAQDHEGADLVDTGKPVESLGQVTARAVLLPQVGQGNQQFGRDGVAPFLDVVGFNDMQVRTGDGRLAEPYVSDFVSEGEYLRSLGVRAVHYTQRKSPKRYRCYQTQATEAPP